MCTEPQGLVLPSDPGRISLAGRLPRGVIGIISPFNFPLILSCRAVAPALATGNAVVLKPDPRTPLTGGFAIARIFEEAGLPKGVLQVLPGGAEAGEALCSDPDIAMIAFTGSSKVGRRIGELAGRHLKKVQLELGGKNAVIVFEDADLDAAASAIAFGAWFHQGQICMTTGRVLARDKIAPSLTEKLVAKANHLPVGDPLGQVALGPVISRQQVDRIDGIVKDTVAAGATLAAGGTFDGPFYRPTVLTGVKPGMRAFDEEVFGPVAAITSFATEDEAVALANASEYGLSAGILSRCRTRDRGRQSPEHWAFAHQRPDRRRRTSCSVRGRRRFGQRNPNRRSRQLGGIYPVAVDEDQGQAEPLSILSQRPSRRDRSRRGRTRPRQGPRAGNCARVERSPMRGDRGLARHTKPWLSRRCWQHEPLSALSAQAGWLAKAKRRRPSSTA